MDKTVSEMVERVARTIARHNYPGASDADIAEMWSGFTGEAIAAIKAMLEATSFVKMAGANAITADHMQKMANYDAMLDCWDAMIRASLGEGWNDGR